MSPRKRREREIVDAAVEVFRTQGYSSASVEDVAASVGLLKGSLYYYVSAKEDLLVRIVDTVHESVTALLDEAATRTDLSALDRLAFYVRSQIEHNARHKAWIAVYIQDYRRLSPDRLAEVEHWRSDYARRLRGWLEEAQAAGEIDPGVDLRAATVAVIPTIMWVHAATQPRRRSAAALADHCVQFMLRGVGAPAGSALE